MDDKLTIADLLYYRERFLREHIRLLTITSKTVLSDELRGSRSVLLEALRADLDSMSYNVDAYRTYVEELTYELHTPTVDGEALAAFKEYTDFATSKGKEWS